MVDMRIIDAVILVVWLVAVVLGARLGLFRAESRIWQVCLYCAVWGAVTCMSIVLLAFGVADVLSSGSLVLMAAGGLGGALAGLIASYFERRWPS